MNKRRFVFRGKVASRTVRNAVRFSPAPEYGEFVTMQDDQGAILHLFWSPDGIDLQIDADRLLEKTP